MAGNRYREDVKVDLIRNDHHPGNARRFGRGRRDRHTDSQVLTFSRFRALEKLYWVLPGLRFRSPPEAVSSFGGMLHRIIVEMIAYQILLCRRISDNVAVSAERFSPWEPERIDPTAHFPQFETFAKERSYIPELVFRQHRVTSVVCNVAHAVGFLRIPVQKPLRNGGASRSDL